jgi:hypothetical protein
MYKSNEKCNHGSCATFINTTFVIPISLKFTHCSTFVVFISYNLVHKTNYNKFSLMSLIVTNVRIIHYKSSSCIQSCIKSNNIHTIINKFAIVLCQQWFIHSKINFFCSHLSLSFTNVKIFHYKPSYCIRWSIQSNIYHL